MKNNMSDETEENYSVEIPFPAVKSKSKYVPIGDYIRLDYTPPEKMGNIVIPGQAQMGLMEFVTCVAAEVGHECKTVTPGAKVLLATKAIMKTPHDGVVTFFTKESAVLAVVS